MYQVNRYPSPRWESDDPRSCLTRVHHTGNLHRAVDARSPQDSAADEEDRTGRGGLLARLHRLGCHDGSKTDAFRPSLYLGSRRDDVIRALRWSADTVDDADCGWRGAGVSAVALLSAESRRPAITARKPIAVTWIHARAL